MAKRAADIDDIEENFGSDVENIDNNQNNNGANAQNNNGANADNHYEDLNPNNTDDHHYQNPSANGQNNNGANAQNNNGAAPQNNDPGQPGDYDNLPEDNQAGNNGQAPIAHGEDSTIDDSSSDDRTDGSHTDTDHQYDEIPDNSDNQDNNPGQDGDDADNSDSDHHYEGDSDYENAGDNDDNQANQANNGDSDYENAGDNDDNNPGQDGDDVDNSDSDDSDNEDSDGADPDDNDYDGDDEDSDDSDDDSDGNGYDGDDELYGGTGNDYMEGGRGYDTYLLDFTDSNQDKDVINNYATDAATTTDLAHFANVNASDITLLRDNDNLILALRATGQSVTVQNFFKGSQYEIDKVMFADGTIWDSAYLKSHLTTSSTARLTTGVDTLTGYTDNDVFIADRTHGEVLQSEDTVDGGTGNNDKLIVKSSANQNIGLEDQYNGKGLSNIETYRFEGGKLAGVGMHVSHSTSLKKIEIASPVAMADGAKYTISTRAANNVLVDLKDVKGTAGGATSTVFLYGNGATKANFRVSGLGDDLTLDVNLGHWAITPNIINIQGYEKESTFTLTNSNGWAGVVNLSGDQDLTINLGNMNSHRGVTVDARSMTAALTLYATLENDGLVIYGARGRNVIDGGNGNDTITGGDSNDTLMGGGGADTLYGGKGNDELVGDVGNDTLYGGEGDDTLYGDQGNDYMEGGKGNDTYYINYDHVDNKGHDTINNYATDANTTTDIAHFGNNLDYKKLWFSKVGNDLQINVVGSDNKVTVDDWYLSANHKLDQIKTSSRTLLSSNVDKLVNAMAAYNVPTGAGSVVPQDAKDALKAVLAQVWS